MSNYASMNKDKLIELLEKQESDLRVTRQAVKETQSKYDGLQKEIDEQKALVEKNTETFKKIEEHYKRNLEGLSNHIEVLVTNLKKEKEHGEHYYNIWFRQYEPAKEE